MTLDPLSDPASGTASAASMLAAAPSAPVAALAAGPPKGLVAERVLSVTHFTDALFAFRTTRASGFRFRAGEFAMLGLPGEDGRPILRAYSIASPAWADELEFYSVKVPDGPLTSRLQRVQPSDEVWLRPRATGTLVPDALEPGRTLWCVSTGTGIAPFASVVRDPETYERFERVIITHTARTRAELVYGRDLVTGVRDDPLLSEMVGGRLTHLTSVTREAPGDPPGKVLPGRVTALWETGALFAAAGTGPLDPAHDRVMICGSTAMIADMRAMCERTGLAEGSNARPGGFVIEKAFVG